MIKILIIAGVLVLSSFCSQTVDSKGLTPVVENEQTEIMNEKIMVKFDIEKLSPQGKKAHQTLLKAEIFEEGLIGFAAQLSRNVENFNILFAEKEADAAFKSLQQNADLAGQLYALSGIFYTDNKHFQEVIKDYEKNDSEISTMSGCIISTEKVSKIIKSNSPNVAIISPDETMKDWWEKNKGVSYEIDIMNGGFPATFRNYKDYKSNRN